MNRFFLILQITIVSFLDFNERTLAASTVEQECSIKTTVSCHITSNHKDCSQIVMKPNICDDIDVSFGFRYCNLHRHTSITLVSGELNVNNALDYFAPLNDEEELKPMSCKEMVKPFRVNSCAHRFQADMIAEGWVDNEIRCKSNDTFYFVKPFFQATA